MKPISVFNESEPTYDENPSVESEEATVAEKATYGRADHLHSITSRPIAIQERFDLPDYPDNLGHKFVIHDINVQAVDMPDAVRIVCRWRVNGQQMVKAVDIPHQASSGAFRSDIESAIMKNLLNSVSEDISKSILTWGFQEMFNKALKH